MGVRFGILAVLLFSTASSLYIFFGPETQRILKQVLLFLNIGLWIYSVSYYFLKIERPARLFETKQLQPFSDTISDLSSTISDFAAGNLGVSMRGNFPASCKVYSGIMHSFCQWNKVLIGELNKTIDEFNAITAKPMKRICFTGNNSYLEGKIAGRETGKYMQGKGTLAILLPMYSQTNHALRVKGFTNILRKDFPNIKIAAIRETTGQREKGEEVTRQLLKDVPELDMIYDTDGFTPLGVCQAIRKAGKHKQVGLETSKSKDFDGHTDSNPRKCR